MPGTSTPRLRWWCKLRIPRCYGWFLRKRQLPIRLSWSRRCWWLFWDQLQCGLSFWRTKRYHRRTASRSIWILCFLVERTTLGRSLCFWICSWTRVQALMAGSKRICQSWASWLAALCQHHLSKRGSGHLETYCPTTAHIPPWKSRLCLPSNPRPCSWFAFDCLT